MAKHKAGRKRLPVLGTMGVVVVVLAASLTANGEESVVVTTAEPQLNTALFEDSERMSVLSRSRDRAPVGQSLAVDPPPPPPPPPPPAPKETPKPKPSSAPVEDVWNKLAQCESGGDWSINTGNGYYGGLQFSIETWRAMGGSGYPHENSKEEQVRIATKLRDARGGYGSWPSCSKKLGLEPSELTAVIDKRYDVGAVKSHVQAAADEIGNKFGVETIGGLAGRAGISDHPKGLALDFMVTGNRGDQIAEYAVNNAERLRVSYVIWYQKINSLDGRGWRTMEDRGGDTANHKDHVHVSFHP